MATLTPQFFQLLEAETKDVFFKKFTQVPLIYTEIFETRNSTKAYEDRIQVAGLGTFATKPEGTPVAFDDPVQGTQVRTTHQTYALGWRASEEMMEDDQHGIMSQMSGDLGESARDHQERLAWGLINDGFTGNTYTGLEGDTLFTASHTQLRTSTGSQSNILSPAVALSQSGLESILNQARTTTSVEGRFIRLEPTKLVIHPNEQHNAYVLLNTEFKPGSSDNDRSTVVSSRSGLMPVESPYLSSTTNWFVMTGPGNNSLTWNNRKSVNFRQADDADTFDKKHYASYRASVMWSTWRGLWGSQA
jgi:phage major head subunit gpT-like protein